LKRAQNRSQGLDCDRQTNLPPAPRSAVPKHHRVRRLRLTSALTQVLRPKPQNYFRKSKFPYISYIFIGKLDLADVHLPDVYLLDMYLRRCIPRTRASYIYRRSHTKRAPRRRIRYAPITHIYEVYAHKYTPMRYTLMRYTPP
jgi:hypothetical protein